MTVHQRVSDIWRSYFTQALLPSVDAVAAFAPAWVEQVSRRFALITRGPGAGGAVCWAANSAVQPKHGVLDYVETDEVQ